MSKSFFKTDGFILAAGDFLAVCLAFFLTSLLNQTFVFSFWDCSERLPVYCGISFILLMSFFIQGHYSKRRPWWDQIRFIVMRTLSAIILEMLANAILHTRTSAALVILNWFLCFLLCMQVRYCIFRLNLLSDNWKIPTVLIGDAASSLDIVASLNSDLATDYYIHTILSVTPTVSDAPHENLKIEYDVKSYRSFIAEHASNFFLFDTETCSSLMTEKMIAALDEAKVSYVVIPSLSRMNIYEMDPQNLFGHDTMLLHDRPSLAKVFSTMCKRLIDISCSLSGMIALAPLFVLIALAMKLEGQSGSIFYDGERVGKDGRHFKCWKFRTMMPNSDHLLAEYLVTHPDAKIHWEKYFKLPHDPRVKTRTAYYLRKFSLDELPQLWNVFWGTMSLVGPRPVLPREIEIYGDQVKEYTKVRPGITGLWQVSGRNAISFQRRIYWDSWYVKNWSVQRDLVIIFQTIPTLLMRQDGH